MTDAIKVHPFFAQLPEELQQPEATLMVGRLRRRVIARLECLQSYLDHEYDHHEKGSRRRIFVRLSSNIDTPSACVLTSSEGRVSVPLFFLVHPQEIPDEFRDPKGFNAEKLSKWCAQLWNNVQQELYTTPVMDGVYCSPPKDHQFDLEQCEMFRLYLETFTKLQPEEIKKWYDFLLFHELGHIALEHGPSSLEPFYRKKAFVIGLLAILFTAGFFFPLGILLTAGAALLLALYAIGGYLIIRHQLRKEKEADLFSAETSSDHAQGGEIFFRSMQEHLKTRRCAKDIPWYAKALISSSGDLRTEAFHHGTATKRLRAIRKAAPQTFSGRGTSL